MYACVQNVFVPMDGCCLGQNSVSSVFHACDVETSRKMGCRVLDKFN